MLPSSIRTNGFDPKSAFTDAYSLLTGTHRPTAIIAGGISILSGVLRAIRAIGLSVPKDISVVGSSDPDLAQLSTPPISVLVWDAEEVGRASAQMMLNRLQGESDSLPGGFYSARTWSYVAHAPLLPNNSAWVLISVEN